MTQRLHAFVIGLVAVALVLSLVPASAHAQAKYPTKPIELIVTFPPGGGCDIAGRLVATYAEKKWGQRVTVVNKPGGNGIPGTLEVLQANPDGYTMLADITTGYTMLHIAMKDLPFKPTDRDLLSIWGVMPTALIVNPSSSYKTLKDAAADAKKDPANFTWTSLGGPSPQDYDMKQFFREIGVDVAKTKPVVCKGGAEAIVMVAGNHVKFGVSSVSAAIPADRAKNIRMMGIVLKDRWAEMPEVPTVYEQGFKNITLVPWVGISAPLNLPANVVTAWNQLLQDMLKDPEIAPKMKNIGVGPYYQNREAARALALKEIDEGKKLWSAK